MLNTSSSTCHFVISSLVELRPWCSSCKVSGVLPTERMARCNFAIFESSRTLSSCRAIRKSPVVQSANLKNARSYFISSAKWNCHYLNTRKEERYHGCRVISTLCESVHWYRFPMPHFNPSKTKDSEVDVHAPSSTFSLCAIFLDSSFTFYSKLYISTWLHQRSYWPTALLIFKRIQTLPLSSLLQFISQSRLNFLSFDFVSPVAHHLPHPANTILVTCYRSNCAYSYTL